MAVKGAVLGDIAGSQFEFNKPAHVDWEHCDLFSPYCSYTDDTVMTLAVKKALMRGEDLVTVMTCNEVFNPERPDTFFEPV